MSACQCGHDEQEHPFAYACQEVVHYPSEDYPCVCSDYNQQADKPGVCQCGHERAKHVLQTMCRHRETEFCSCLKFQPKGVGTAR